MATHKRKKRSRPPLDERHYLAIELLTTVPTPNLDDIARACTVDRRTLYRWRQRKDFDRELRKAIRRKIDSRVRHPHPIRTVEDIEFIMRINGFI